MKDLFIAASMLACASAAFSMNADLDAEANAAAGLSAVTVQDENIRSAVNTPAAPNCRGSIGAPIKNNVNQAVVRLKYTQAIRENEVSGLVTPVPENTYPQRFLITARNAMAVNLLGAYPAQ
ncbi:MAG: hypothetical protein V4482_03920 [Pseudomonadota bacterium]